MILQDGANVVVAGDDPESAYFSERATPPFRNVAYSASRVSTSHVVSW